MPRQAGLPRTIEMETELSRHLAGDLVLDIENAGLAHGNIGRNEDRLR